LGTSTIAPGLVSKPFDLHADYGLATYDVRHIGVINAVYTLPFGKEQPFANSLEGWSNALVGGSLVPGRHAGHSRHSCEAHRTSTLEQSPVSRHRTWRGEIRTKPQLPSTACLTPIQFAGNADAAGEAVSRGALVIDEGANAQHNAAEANDQYMASTNFSKNGPIPSRVRTNGGATHSDDAEGEIAVDAADLPRRLARHDHFLN
jgi:hypothetical protein